MNEEIAKELAMLDEAQAKATNACYFRFESFSRALDEVNFPYTLVQTWERNVRGNLYYWTGKWDKGSIYVQETEAGRKCVHGIRNAIAALRNVLTSYAA